MTNGCKPVSVSRRIGVPADKVFGLLADPTRHPAFDGSGMLRAAVAGTAISAPGQVFTMKMYNAEMGDYEVSNHVVEYELNSRIGWEPVLSDASRSEDMADIGTRLGHRWAYELTVVSPDTTDVTEIYDCSNAPEWLRVAVYNGDRWLEGMRRSLEMLERELCAVN